MRRRLTLRDLMTRGVMAASLSIAVLPAAALAAPPAGSRLESAIKSSARSDRDLRAFYRAAGNRPLWVRGGSVGPEADQLMALIARADLDGLDPRRYDLDEVAEAIDRARDGSPKALARAEMRLSRAFVDYVGDIHQPANTGMIYIDRELTPTPPDPQAILRSAATAPSLASHLRQVGQINPFYSQLRKGLAEHRARGVDASFLPSIAIPSGPVLKAGATGERVRLLRSRLGLYEDGGFDAEVARELRSFQAANGLPVDAVAGPRTLAALNGNAAPPADRERLLRLNLERARALHLNQGRRHVVVDAAAAKLYMYEDGRLTDSMRVIVGKPAEPTPMIAGLIRHAVVNPYWNVPTDLVKSRIVPGVTKRGAAAYFKSERYQVLSDWSENARVLDPKSVDWKAVSAGREQVRIRQLPGKGNSMGKMKFMFPNDMGIWLHDTPDKALFAKADRQFSAGCVRVEDAQRLARWLFRKPLVADTDEPEQHVALPEPVPIYITYLTAAPEANGIAYRSDFYNRDREQLARLGGRGDGGAP